VTEVGGGVLQENGYALAGERTTRSGAYGTYRYLGPTVTDGSTGLNAHVFVNGTRVATDFPAGTYFYMGDQLGSTTMVLDGRGDVVTQVVQSPYGREVYQSAAPDWAPPAQQFLLTGKERDPETGFHAYGWRDWSSAGNHWLAPEPIWEDALKQDAVGLNLYHLARWNAVGHADPDGRIVVQGKPGLPKPTAEQQRALDKISSNSKIGKEADSEFILRSDVVVVLEEVQMSDPTVFLHAGAESGPILPIIDPATGKRVGWQLRIRYNLDLAGVMLTTLYKVYPNLLQDILAHELGEQLGVLRAKEGRDVFGNGSGAATLPIPPAQQTHEKGIEWENAVRGAEGRTLRESEVPPPQVKRHETVEQ
jgi:RHS repeat-associated protein